MLDIVKAPNPVLAQLAKPVTVGHLGNQVLKVDSYIHKLISEMIKALDSARDPQGVGLAAPQIGKPLRLFIIKPTVKSKAQAFINPTITHMSSKKGEEVDQSEKTKKLKEKSGISDGKMLEGCLSLPSIWGEVQRQKELKLSYIDEHGKSHSKLFKGFPAIIIQHEVDHLNGILFPKRVLEQKGKLYKSKKNKKGEDVFGEIEI